MSGHDPTELLLMPSLRAMQGPNGGLVLTRKYLSGVERFSNHWPGPVTSLVRLDEVPTTDMDHVEVMPDATRPGIELRPDDRAAFIRRISNAAAVTLFLSRDEAPTARLCHAMGVPVVFVSEYTARTERQIVRAQTSNPVLRLRRFVWIARTEAARRRVLPLAAGLQCSGTPTFDAYEGLNPNRLLFFDNRVPEADVLTETALAAKAAALHKGRPLRLVFGGRLIEMKGVMDLPELAEGLRRRGVPFTLDIYGSGPLAPALAARISALGLTDPVRLRGAVDFATEWIPALKSDADLFVCCHPQGDPSSTYPEVMSCGLPIAGYGNEAFAGILRHSGAGWSVPIHDHGALADEITRLHTYRTEIVDRAARARAFAAEHAFERTAARRVGHYIAASRLPPSLKSRAPG